MKRLAYLFAPVLFVTALVGCGTKPAPNTSADANQPASTALAQSQSGSTDALPFSKRDQKTDSGSKSGSLVPNTVTIPAGTSVAVRLQQSVSSASSNAGDRFDAVLDEPLVINGQTVAPRGAAAVGKVVQAK